MGLVGVRDRVLFVKVCIFYNQKMHFDLIIMWYWFLFLFACTTLAFLSRACLMLTHYFIQSTLKVSNKGVDKKTWNKIFKCFRTFDLLALKAMLDEMYPKMAENFISEISQQIIPNNYEFTV